jgi:phage-related protein
MVRAPDTVRRYRVCNLMSPLRGGRDSDDPDKKIVAIFYRTEAGGEPVGDWLRSLSLAEKKLIGADIKTVEFGWPIGMPVCRPLGSGLFEVRTKLPNRIARIIFYVDKQERMVLLHGFIKKTKELDDDDLELARSNKNKHERGMK